MDLTIPTSWHAGPHSLSLDLINYIPQEIWLLISSYFDARHLIHALSDDIILALWIKQIGLWVIVADQQFQMRRFHHLHNPFGGPACIKIWPDGIREETWFEDNKRHRIGNPAYIETQPNGHREEIWYENNKRHRLDGPAYIEIYPDGHRIEKWYENNKRHRLDGPAYIETQHNGRRTEIWYQDDVQVPPPAK